SELRSRLRAAEEAVRARDDFLAIAAHELRSPLNALALRLRALERLAARSAEPSLQDGLERAARSVDRYVSRAVVLLDLSRMQAGALVPDLSQVSSSELLQNVVEAYRDEAEFHGAALQAEVVQDATGWWDPHMLEQILSNLVSNAIKYGNGTPVRVSAGSAGTGFASFEVEDGGPGIAPADRDRIFEKFERVVATSRDRAGFGLGLWIVGRMVAVHQGRIDIVEGARGGALFRVTLPLQATVEHQKDPSQ
ncbi:MAG: HAMP domain-containing histidine kinase, partial [Comamonadaceae bacterium]